MNRQRSKGEEKMKATENTQLNSGCNLVAGLDFLRVAVAELGLQQMMILFTIFENEGITQHDLVERFNFHQGSVSKNCKKLSTYEIVDPRTKEPITAGLGLIRLQSATNEYRKVECHLTAKGKNVRKQFYRALSVSINSGGKRYGDYRKSEIRPRTITGSRDGSGGFFGD
jgi:DNA-binding MarR family transcriptional regulator